MRPTIGRRLSRQLLWHVLLFLPISSANQLFCDNEVLQQDKS